MSERALIYIPSSEIVDYITINTIDWADNHKELAKRGGVGDSVGVTPTPAVEEFLNLLIAKRGLFTQYEYMAHCWESWRSWVAPKSQMQKLGLRARLYRNFYPSMIDSLHVWAMLCESGMFDLCFMSATEDAIGKSDLILHSGKREIRLALIGPTGQASSDRQYKIEHRNNGEPECIQIKLNPNYPKSPGNKRWFRKSDVMQAIMSRNNGGLDLAAD